MVGVSSVPKLFDLSNQVAIVTGSGRGLGAAIARGLAAAGASVMLCSRTQAEVECIAVEIVRNGGKAAAVVADTSDRASCQRLIDQTISKFGKLNVLVNNAGIDSISPAEDLDGRCVGSRRQHQSQRLLYLFSDSSPPDAGTGKWRLHY